MPRHLILLLLPFLGLPAPAAAHPHVFVDAAVGFRVEGTELSSLRVSWVYDEFTSLILFDILSLDADGDGLLNDADLARVVEGETDWPDDYNGDIYLEAGGRQVALGRPMNASAEMPDDRIIVHFDLPLSAPLDLTDGPAILRLYDPNYYYAYTVTVRTGPMFEAGACAATVTPFEPDETTSALQDQLAALSREEFPEQENVGRLFADEVVLTCD